LERKTPRLKIFEFKLLKCCLEQKFAEGKLAASSSALREEKKTSAEALAFVWTCRKRLCLKLNYFNAALSAKDGKPSLQVLRSAHGR
jgi:hypothetical protein